MGLGNRHARRHDTRASRTAAGFTPADYDPSWDFKPGQRVMTCDGYPGVVASVEEGLLGRADQFLVNLDSDMGHGYYSSGQLTDTVPDKHANLGSAVASYPELGTILVDRPDPAKVVVYASLKKQAWEQGDEAGTHFDGDMCPECGKIVSSIHPDDDLDTHRAVEHSAGPLAEHDEPSTRTASNDPEAPLGQEGSCAECGGPIFRSEETDGQWAHAYADDDHHHPIHRTGSWVPPYQSGDEIHHPEYGRGEILSVDDDGTAQVQYDKDGRNEDHPRGTLRKRRPKADDYGPTWNVKTGAADQGAYDFGEPDMDEHGHLSWGGHSPACGDTDDSQYSMMGQNDAAQRSAKTAEVSPAETKTAPCLARPGMVHPEGQCRCFTGGPTPRFPNTQRDYHFHGSVSPWSLIHTAAADSDFGFEVTASWSDVRAKAKRIRSEGRINVTSATSGLIFAEVKGDHHVYEAGLQRMPGKQAIQQWTCGCKWGAYHWGADDDMSRFAGRMCSHALALHYEAQSRGMFGREVISDDEKPTWAPRRVVVKYDIDDGRNVTAPATQPRMPFSGSALSCAASLLRRSGEDRYELLLALSALGLGSRRVVASVNNAWGDPSQPEPTFQPGPTKPVNPNDNPASMGWATNADPDSWNQHGDSVGVYGSLEVTADWNPLTFGTGDAADAPNTGQQQQKRTEEDADQHKPEEPEDDKPEENKPEENEPEDNAPKPEEGAAEEGAAGAEEGAAGLGEAAAGAGEAAAGASAADLLPLLLLASADGGDDSIFEPDEEGATATLHDEPEAALPSTDGSLEDVVAAFQATAAAKSLGGPGGADGGDGGEMAEMVRATMAKEGMKEFTPAERRMIINEGSNVRARNLDKMDIAGTHYEDLERESSLLGETDDWLA